jgi:hypothetical protein
MIGWMGMANGKKQPQEMKDKELVEFATAFLNAYSASAKSADGSSATMNRDRPYSLGPGGIVEITEEISEAQSGFVHRAAKLLKSKAVHEKAISKIGTDHAHKFVAAGNKKVEDAVASMIEEVFEKAATSFEYLAPNYLIRFESPVTQIKIGRVKAMRTADFSAERKALYPDHQVEIVPGNGFSLQFTPKIIIEMRAICWIVNVDAVAENVEEEGKWLIDVAVSYLRLSHEQWLGNYPRLGIVEPHPVRSTLLHNEGVKMQGPRLLAGGGSVPAWYEIDAAVLATSETSKFTTSADLLFDPPKKSLAERVSQGLGWLTRGRQAEDRAERLLYFFTAIEALLSNDDKTAPVVQTIARHAAVLLTNDNVARAEIANEVKKLYAFRSALVHAGNRGVLWSGANGAQMLAEAMFSVVLEKVDLKIKHESFCNEVAAASYGAAWPPP